MSIKLLVIGGVIVIVLVAIVLLVWGIGALMKRE
jgi:hypothetical protein